MREWAGFGGWGSVWLVGERVGGSPGSYCSPCWTPQGRRTGSSTLTQADGQAVCLYVAFPLDLGMWMCDALGRQVERRAVEEGSSGQRDRKPAQEQAASKRAVRARRRGLWGVSVAAEVGAAPWPSPGRLMISTLPGPALFVVSWPDVHAWAQRKPGQAPFFRLPLKRRD